MSALVRLLLAVLVVGIALQCQDRHGPTEVDSTGLQTATAESDILDLLGEIFDGSLEGAAKTQARNMFRQYARFLSSGDPALEADAQAKAIALVDFILEKHANGQTAGDDEQVFDAVLMILAFVGFDVELSENPLEDDADSAIAVCGSEGCEVVTETEHAGVFVPAGAFDEQVVIIIQRLPDFPPIEIDGLAPAVSNFYPLPSGLDQYLLFYDISTIPEGVELNAGFFADVGLCVLEQDDGWENGAPSDVLPHLRLAHPAPDGPGTGNCDDDIECLPIVTVNFLDCADLEEGPVEIGFRGLMDDFTRAMVSPFSPSLLYASPGDLGGQASSFSPFAAVDTTSGQIATTTTLDAEPDTVFVGGAITLTATVSPAPPTSEEPEVYFYEGEAFLGSGFTNTDGVATLILDTSVGCEFNCLSGTGSHTLTAEFLGTPSHDASTSNPVTVLLLAPIG